MKNLLNRSLDRIALVCLYSLYALLLAACSGGGSDVNLGGGSGGGTPNNPTVSDSGAERWKVFAQVSSDSCGERISDVRQTFSVQQSGGVVVADSSASVYQGNDVGSGFLVSFQETNGECTRTYSAQFSNVSGGTANVELTSHSDCSGRVCESHWIGTAQQE